MSLHFSLIEYIAIITKLLQNDQHNSIGTNKVSALTVGNLFGTAVAGLSVGECVGGSVVGWGDGLWVGILVGIRVVGRDYTFMFMMPCAVTIHCPKETTQNG